MVGSAFGVKWVYCRRIVDVANDRKNTKSKKIEWGERK